MGGYWLGPSISTLAATARIASGPSWSGKPWPRLIGLVLDRQRRHHGEDGGGQAGENGIETGEVAMARHLRVTGPAKARAEYPGSSQTA